MKKSKTDPSIKLKKSKNPTLKIKKKRKTSPLIDGRLKILKKEQVPRKSRWEDAATKVSQDLKKIKTPVLPSRTEKEDVRDSPRIKSLLEDKQKIVEQLFVTVSGKALDDIIPDYLRKRSIDELKKLCLAELEKMANDEILDIISGDVHPLFKEQETQTEFNANSKDNVVVGNEDIKIETETKHFKKVASTGMNVRDAQNQAQPEVIDDVTKDLGISEGDAELLELEMRARAIRSLLKLKSNDEFDMDSNILEDE